MDSIKTALAEAFDMGVLYEVFKNNDNCRDRIVEMLCRKHNIEENNSAETDKKKLSHWTCDSRVVNLAETDKKKLSHWINREPEKAKEIVDIFFNLHCRNWITVDGPAEKFNSIGFVLEKNPDNVSDRMNIAIYSENYGTKQNIVNRLGNSDGLDHFVINHLVKMADTNMVWDFADAQGDTIMEKYESLYIKIVEISNVIHRKTLRGGANFIVASPEIAAIFEAGFRAFENHDKKSLVSYCGTVNSRWKLYKNSLMKSGTILVGYKGNSDMDSGMFMSFDKLTGEQPEFAIGLREKAGDFYGTIEMQNFMF